MAGRIGEHMESVGTKFIKGCSPTKLEKNGEKIVVHYTQEGEAKSDEFDTVLFAIGRTACTDGLNLAAAGIKAESNGKIKVDDVEATTVPNIFAIGDVIYGKLELTPVAIKAGLLLSKRLFGGSDEKMDYINVPTTVFTPLEYGTVGHTEESSYSTFGEENILIYHT